MGSSLQARSGVPFRRGGACGHEHLVQFYETESFLVDTVSDFIGSALHDGAAAIVVATASHRSAFEAALHASGVDMAAAAGRYLALDATETLGAFMIDGVANARLFGEVINAIIERVAADGRAVRIYGEMVAVLWAAGDVSSAIALEDLWNDLGGEQDFALLCAYPMSAFDSEASAAAFRRVCEQHETVIPSEGYSLLDDADHQRRAVARLQQETVALRGDVARLSAEQKILAELAYLDALTGLANRRAFDRDLEREWGLSGRDGTDSIVVVADLDGFKEYNDRHGHAAGDEALRHFAAALNVATRSTDVVARIGGDEFAILLVRCRETAVVRFQASVREAMVDPARPGGLDVSFGHASLCGSTSAADALEDADLAMFARKRASRLGTDLGG